MPIITQATGSTVSQVADRVFREYLHQGDDQPVVVHLASDVNETATAWSISTDTLTTDEVDLLAPGVLVETYEGEQVVIVSYDSGTLEVRRGHAGTDAVPHVAGETLTVAPVFTRRQVIDAVCDVVVGLYPALYRVATVEVDTADGPIEVPADAVTSIDFSHAWGSSISNVPAHLIDWPGSSTGKAIVVDAPTGLTGYFTYRGRFPRPSSSSDALSDYGVEPTWERIVVVGAAAQAVAGRDLDQLTSEYITEQLERESLPGDVPSRVRDGLLRLYALWLDQAQRGLRADDPQPVTYLDTRYAVRR